MATYQLSVNGQSRSIDVAPEMPLLWVLRDTLELRGTKFGCGRGICGACTVLVDGAATRSCITPVGSVARQGITTIEGLAPAGGLHPVQAAWIEDDVPQCGYCQAGQIMMAVSLLAREAASVGRRDPRRDVGQHVPLRHLPAHSPRRAPRVAARAARRRRREVDDERPAASIGGRS